jgi:hypothetical protein
MTVRTVAWCLASFMDPEGVCYPSLPTIAEGAGISLAAAKRGLKELDDEGWVEREGGGGRGKTTHYRARIPAQHVAGLADKPAQPGGETGSLETGNRLASGPGSIQEVSNEGAAPSEPEGSAAPWLAEGLTWQAYAAAHPRHEEEALEA